MFSTYFDATDAVQAISTELRTQAWLDSRRQATGWAQWNAYLNQICLEACLQNLRAEDWPSAVGMNAAQADRTWAVVNGAVLTVGDKRVALIPTEAVDQSELEVPQEWIDLPSWAADYYLAVYLMPDLATLQIAGYVTHGQVQQQGQLDVDDRSYHLDITALTTDLNLLSLMLDRYDAATTRGPIAALASLTEAQAQNLIQRLGAPTELMPRWEVPFATWAALLDNPTWHEQLHRQRLGLRQSAAMATRLADWLQGQYDRTWQAVDTVLSPPQLAVATRSQATPSVDDLVDAAVNESVSRAKVLVIGAGQVGLLVNVVPLSPIEVRIDLQIHPTGNSIHLPGETAVRLLGGDGAEIVQAKAAVTETIRLQFRANYGEAFQLEIRCNDQVVTEQFVL
jgi:Protein of unknown function (DUF1822)